MRLTSKSFKTRRAVLLHEGGKALDTLIFVSANEKRNDPAQHASVSPPKIENKNVFFLLTSHQKYILKKSLFLFNLSQQHIFP